MQSNPVSYAVVKEFELNWKFVWRFIKKSNFYRFISEPSVHEDDSHLASFFILQLLKLILQISKTDMG